MANETPVASKPLTAGQRADKAEAQVQELLPKVGALEATNAALETKVAEQERMFNPVREDLSVIREKRNVLQRLVDAARTSTLADWIRFRRDAMSGGHDDHVKPSAAPKKSSGRGGLGGGSGFGGGLGKLLTAIVLILIAAVVIGAVWKIFFDRPASSTTTTTTMTEPVAPEVVAPVKTDSTSVDADPAPALAGLPDTPENRGIEMVEANCPGNLKTTTGDSFTPWDDMQYNASFYSYELALQQNCNVTISKLDGDRTPDDLDGCSAGTTPFLDTETNMSICVYP